MEERQEGEGRRGRLGVGWGRGSLALNSGTRVVCMAGGGGDEGGEDCS